MSGYPMLDKTPHMIPAEETSFPNMFTWMI